MSFERPQIIRPPSEHASYFLPVTAGCSNNSCAFCNYYGVKLRLRELDEIKNEIDAMALHEGSGIVLPTMPQIVYRVLQGWDGRRVFLQDGDALVYPFPKLIEVLDHLNEKFPHIERIASYATPQDLLRRHVDELIALRQRKLGILYMGVESGDDEVLKKIHKGVNHEQLVEAGRKAKEAGITLSVTVILGLGEDLRSQRHAKETGRVLTEIDPEFAGALTLTLVPGTPLYKQWKEGEFTLISPFASLEELRMIVENSDFTYCFFSSMHASNYVAVRGRLPQEKQRMLKELDSVLRQRDPTMLRPEFLRGM